MLVKYSDRGLFNEKGKIYPLYEKLYLVAVLVFYLVPFSNFIVLLSNTKNPKIYSNRWVINCYNQTDVENSSIKHVIMIRTIEALTLTFHSILYFSILYKVKGKKLFPSKFGPYQKNLVTLKETFVFTIIAVFSNIIRFALQFDFFGYSCLVYFLFCIVSYFIYPIHLLKSLRKTLPQFHTNILNIQFDNEMKIYPRKNQANLIPRNPVFTKNICDSKSTEMNTAQNIGIKSLYPSNCNNLPEIFE